MSELVAPKGETNRFAEVAAYLGIGISILGVAASKWVVQMPALLVVSVASVALCISFFLLASVGRWRTVLSIVCVLLGALLVASIAMGIWYWTHRANGRAESLESAWQISEVQWDADPLGPNREGTVRASIDLSVNGVPFDSNDGTARIHGYVGERTSTHLELSVSGRRFYKTLTYSAPGCEIGSRVPPSAVARSGMAISAGLGLVATEKGYILLSAPDLSGYQEHQRGVLAIGLIRLGEPLTVLADELAYDLDCNAYVYVRRGESDGVGWIRLDSVRTETASESRPGDSPSGK